MMGIQANEEKAIQDMQEFHSAVAEGLGGCLCVDLAERARIEEQQSQRLGACPNPEEEAFIEPEEKQ